MENVQNRKWTIIMCACMGMCMHVVYFTPNKSHSFYLRILLSPYLKAPSLPLSRELKGANIRSTLGWVNLRYPERICSPETKPDLLKIKAEISAPTLGDCMKSQTAREVFVHFSSICFHTFLCH